MSDVHAKCKELIKNAKKIVVIGHQGPDPDAISSILLVRGFVKAQYKQKKVFCVVDGVWGDYAEGLVGIDEVQNRDPYDAVREYEPDLIILVDANDPKRFSQEYSEEFADWLILHGKNVICIDHHEPTKLSASYAITYNIQASNCAEEVFDTFSELNFPAFQGMYELVMLGMISDTGRFLYPNNYPQRTFGIAAFALGSGVTIEKVASKLETYNRPELSIASSLMKNLKDYGGFNLAYLSDEESITLWKEAGENRAVFSAGAHIVINQFLKNTRPNHCGITLYKDMLEENAYKGSLRSFKDVLDCNVVAQELGGGGHKTAAGFKFTAHNFEEARAKVVAVMKKHLFAAN